LQKKSVKNSGDAIIVIFKRKFNGMKARTTGIMGEEKNLIKQGHHTANGPMLLLW